MHSKFISIAAFGLLFFLNSAVSAEFVSVEDFERETAAKQFELIAEFLAEIPQHQDLSSEERDIIASRLANGFASCVTKVLRVFTKDNGLSITDFLSYIRNRPFRNDEVLQLVLKIRTPKYLELSKKCNDAVMDEVGVRIPF